MQSLRDHVQPLLLDENAPTEFLERAKDWLRRRGGTTMVHAYKFKGDGIAPEWNLVLHQGQEPSKHDWNRALWHAVSAYTPLNPCLVPPESLKASKHHVVEVRGFGVDLDVAEPADDSADKWRHQLDGRAACARVIEEYVIRHGLPTECRDSGGGFQLVFRLAAPVALPPARLDSEGFMLREDGITTKDPKECALNPDRERAIAEVEARNRGLFERFRSLVADLGVAHLVKVDATQNIDRIFRVPHTPNRPCGKKRGRGRRPTMARLVFEDQSITYAIESFQRAAESSARKGSSQQARTAVRVQTGQRRHVNLDELPKSLDSRVCVIITKGLDDEQPLRGGDQSRSAWLLHAVGSLVRAKVPDDDIYAIITDPDYGISASVLDKGTDAQVNRYACRQITRAKEIEDTPDWVADVNRDRFAALDGGKVRFFREEDDGGLTTMDKAAFDYDIADRWATEVEDGKPKAFQVSKRWHSHGRRRYYPKGLRLDPSSEDDDGKHYNLWKGFSVQPAPGDWSLLRDHFYKVMDKDHADYLIRSMAWKVQNPGVPSRVAIVLRGKEGTGKGIGITFFTELFGKHGLRVHSMLHVAGRFNAHLRHLCVLFADEVYVVGKDQVGTLKGLITERNLPIEGKGVDVVDAQNHVTVYMVTNEHWAVPAGLDARRFAVFDVKDVVRGQHEYFDAIDRQMKDGGCAAMLHDLIRMDLGDWHPEAARPDTEALAEQKAFGLDPIPDVLFECLQAGQLPFGHQQKDGTVRIGSIQFTDWVGMKKRRDDVTTTMLGVVFGRLDFTPFKGKPKGWDIPKLAEARAAWDETMFPWKWDAQEDEEWSIVRPPRRDDPPQVTDAF